MARIEGVPRSQARLMVKLGYRFGARAMRKLTGRDPQAGSGIEPMEIWAQPGARPFGSRSHPGFPVGLTTRRHCHAIGLARR